MLPLLAFRTCYSRSALLPRFKDCHLIALRLASTEVSQASSIQPEQQQFIRRKLPVIPKDGPERDLVNFPRPVRALNCGKVRFGFIPDEWFQFFYKKTGVTGPYLFTGGLATYLLSKELLVVEHEFWTGFTITLMVVFAVKKFGKQTSAYLDKLTEEYNSRYDISKEGNMKSLEDSIAAEKKNQWHAEGQRMLFDAKKENVNMQLEAEYRKRIMSVYEEVKKRLDYQLDVQNTVRRFQQTHMVNWIVSNVLKGITPQQEKEALQKCITDLKGLASRV